MDMQEQEKEFLLLQHLTNLHGNRIAHNVALLQFEILFYFLEFVLSQNLWTLTLHLHYFLLNITRNGMQEEETPILVYFTIKLSSIS